MALTKTTFSMIKNAPINVMDFGATGNGVTDDTTSIQAAIAYAETSATPPSAAPGVVEIYFPFGVYVLIDTLTVTKSLSFVGEGHSEYSTGSRLIQNTAAKDHFKVDPISAGCSVSWNNLTMTANGNGGTGGACINITKTTATCNSVRIYECTFGTPQTLAIKIQASDDVQITGNLFDVSATGCIALGTSLAGNGVSNCAILNNAFFGLANSGLQVFNINGLIIANNRVYPNPGSPNLTTFVDGYNTLPYQLENIVVQGNSFRGIDCILRLDAVNGLIFANNNGVNLGAGPATTLSCVQLTSTCSNINITGNVLSGTFDTDNFYNDIGATVSGAMIGGNTFANTGGTGQSMVCANTTGSITVNAMTGFVSPSVSEQIYTTGNAISPGTINSLTSYTFTKTITGARQGDRVTLTPSSTTWPGPDGIVITSFVSAANTVTIKYTNVTGSPIGVPAHDFGILVTR